MLKSNENINKSLYIRLSQDYPEMLKEVLEQDYCDIDGEFLGFVDTYYYLSKIIPKDWDVVDFGCAYNPQAYYFIDHNSFTGVDIGKIKRFKFKNTTIFTGTINEYLIKLNRKRNKVFAICNNVSSSETKLVREYYPNCFIYYVA